MDVLIKQKSRIWELDFIRGIAVLLMIFDHIMVDFMFSKYWFSNFYAVNNPTITALNIYAEKFFQSGLRTFGHYFFAFVFFFITGACGAFSRSNEQRGAKVLVVAGAITAVTLIIEKIINFNIGIIWGVLHCIGFSLLTLATLVCILNPLFKLLHKKIASTALKSLISPENVILLIGAGIMLWGILTHWYNTEFLKQFKISDLSLMIAGFARSGGDSFGFVPYAGMTLIGYCFGRKAYKSRKSRLAFLDGKWHAPVSFVGRHSLFIYIAHQILAVVVIGGVCLILGYRF